jgi:hypothetical protein
MTTLSPARPTGSEHDLAATLQQALQATLFASGQLITPRRIAQVARDIGAAFRAFEQQNDCDAVCEAGRRLATEGLGHGSVLAIVEALHGSSWRQGACPEDHLPASVRYCGKLLEGYMSERESSLLREQERTRLALERARAQHSSAPPQDAR